MNLREIITKNCLGLVNPELGCGCRSGCDSMDIYKCEPAFNYKGIYYKLGTTMICSESQRCDQDGCTHYSPHKFDVGCRTSCKILKDAYCMPEEHYENDL